MKICDICQPVSSELVEVEARLAEILTSSAPHIRALAERVQRRRGKLLRPSLVLLAGRVCGPLTRQHVDLAAIVELVHTASLVHDDVIDEADLRRRLPSMRAQWGNQVAVLFGDLAFSKAFGLLAELDLPWASAQLAHTTSRMCEGELNQLLRRCDASLREAEYLDIIEAKTAALFETSCRFGAGASNAGCELADKLGQHGRGLGVAFQIVDDCLDLTGDEAAVGKTLYTDLENGRVTLPLIRVLERAAEPSDGRLCEMLFPGQGAPERSVVSAMIAEHDAIGYSLGVAKRFCNAAKAQLGALPNSPAKRSLLDLADYVLARER